MDRFYRKRLDEPDEVLPFDHGRADIIQLGNVAVGRVIQEPGWRWSQHVKPLVGTELCETRHFGLAMSGALHIRLRDGTEYEIRAGDVFEIPPGHDGWVVGDEPFVEFDFGGLRQFLPWSLDGGDRVLATVVFTDIVDSTQQLERLGDAVWRRRLDAHDEVVRRVLDRYRGRLVKSTGDGILALFDSAARAIRAAAAVRDEVAGLDIRIRAAAHTGEVEVAGTDLSGIAVHEAARLLSVASAGEVVVSSTTRDLTAGSGLAFDDRGAHELKGLSGPRGVFVLVTDPAATPDRSAP